MPDCHQDSNQIIDKTDKKQVLLVHCEIYSPTTTVNDRPPTTGSALFREEALRAQSPSTFSPILLLPRAGHWWLAALSALLALALLSFLFLGSYTRHTAVTGQLQPSAGLVRVYTPQAGVVLSKKVTEGQLVHQGDVLFVISSDRADVQSRQIEAGIGDQVDQRRQSLQSEIERNRHDQAQELEQLDQQNRQLRAEADTVAQQIEQQRQRLAIAQDSRDRYQNLVKQDFVAREQLQQKELELSEQQSRLQALQRDALTVQGKLLNLQREAQTTRTRLANQNAELQRQISLSTQELAEVDARRQVVVTAPQTGLATLVDGDPGQLAELSRPLLYVIPQGSSLQAKLLAPSRSIGFVKPGQKVLLRYAAFPYQKFGHFEGVVSSVSASAYSANDTTPSSGKEGALSEPVYLITVQLAQQSVPAYGQTVALQPGMRVDAEILQERRHLYEWLLEPLYSVSGKLP